MKTRWLRILVLSVLPSLCFAPNQTLQAAPQPALPTLKLYVANEDDGTISVIDAVQGKVVSVIATMRKSKSGMEMFMTHNVQVSPDGKSVWVTAPPMEEGAGHKHVVEDEVFVIDPATDEIVHTVKLGTEQHIAHVVFDAESRFAYVTAYKGDKVLKVDAKTFVISSTFTLRKKSGPHGARLCGDQLFIAEMGGKALAILNTTTGDITTVPLMGTAVQTACTSNGKYAFASLFDSREIVRFDTKTKAIARFAMPKGSQGPVQIYLSPDDGVLYVADQGVLMGRPASDKLVAFNVESGSVEAIIKVGKGPHGIVVAPGGTQAFVTNLVDGTVSVVDLVKKKTTSTIKVGKKPNGISAWTAKNAAP